MIRPDVIDDDPTDPNFFALGEVNWALIPGGFASDNLKNLYLLTRDGEFHTDANGFLRAANGYYLVTVETAPNPFGNGESVLVPATFTRAVFNDLDIGKANAPSGSVLLSTFLDNPDLMSDALGAFMDPSTGGNECQSILKVTGNKQNLRYSHYGSTYFHYDFSFDVTIPTWTVEDSLLVEPGHTSDATILAKSLEASNSSMTQSVPELSLAQKLFSALTKVLQTSQTNVDSVLNTIR